MKSATVARVILIAVIALVVVYICDYAVLRIRISRGGANAGFGSVAIVYGAALKDGRASLFTDQPQLETCVHSVFPHMGYPTCWYTSKHSVQIVN